MAESRDQKGIGSVEIAIGILRLIEQAPGPVSLTQIAKAAGFLPSKTHHYLVSMIRTGLVSQEPTRGLYTLGRYALQLGLTALARTEAGSITAQAVRELRDRTGQTTFFSLWGDHGPVVVHSEQGLRTVTVHVRIGTVFPLYGSATSDVFLAWMPDAQLAPLLNKSGSGRGVSLRDVAETRTRVRKAGVAHQSNTRTPNVTALAVPVFSKGGILAGVLTSVGFHGDFDDDPKSEHVHVLKTYARNLSHELGFAAGPPPA